MPGDRYVALKGVATWEQADLRRRAFLVAGVGALGNEVAKNLALLGAGRVALVDFDRVAISNLSRSVLFRAEDVGQPKVEVAARALRQLNSDVRLVAWDADVTRGLGAGVFRRMDLVFGCVDSVAARYHLNRLCWSADVPWVEGGLGPHVGSVRVFQPQEGPCYECTLSVAERRALNPRRFSCSDASGSAARSSVATTPLIASITGALMVQQALALLGGEDVGGRGWHINAATGEAFSVRVTRRPECLGHDRGFGKDVIEMPATARELRLRDFLDFASSSLGPDVSMELSRSIVVRLTCPKCGQSEAVWLDREDLVDHRRRCAVCGTMRRPAYVRSLGRDAPVLDRRLAELGIPPLEIVVAGNGRAFRFFELTGDAAACLPWA